MYVYVCLFGKQVTIFTAHTINLKVLDAFSRQVDWNQGGKSMLKQATSEASGATTKSRYSLFI